jgi:hypothetical protein
MFDPRTTDCAYPHLPFWQQSLRSPHGAWKPMPGISSKSQFLLDDCGLSKACHLLGQYLLMDKDSARFAAFLKDLGLEEAEQIALNMSAWVDSNM